MNWKRFAIWVPLNAIFVYVCVYATWQLLSYLTGALLVGEDAAFLEAIYAPLATIVIVIVIYALSILDTSILRPTFIGIATITTECAAFAIIHWSVKPLDERLDFLVHAGLVVACFVAWRALRPLVSYPRQAARVSLPG